MFLNDLVVKLVKDDQAGLWELTQPFEYASPLTGTTITAPAGFQTDFCSVPRVPIAFDLLGNRARRSGVVHDWLYTCHIVSREMADKVLREMLMVDGLDAFEAQEFYLGVRIGGGSHWGPDPEPAGSSAALLH